MDKIFLTGVTGLVGSAFVVETFRTGHKCDFVCMVRGFGNTSAADRVVSIIRDEKEIVPHGATVLETHDKLVVLCDEYFAGELEEILDSMCKTMVQP